MFAFALAFTTVLANATTVTDAQTTVPASAATTCAYPNLEPNVVTAAIPVLPPIARQQGISGTVAVRIELDEQSRIVSATITRTPSALLNNAALAAARGSTFQTRVVSCHPVAETYLFMVSFVNGPPPAPPSISDYFLGTWYCRSEIKSQIVKAYGLSANGTALTLDNSYIDTDGVIVLSQETYTQGPAGITVRSPFGGYNFVGTSSGWNGTALVFTGPLTSQLAPGSTTPAVTTTQRMTYTRLDDDRFTRMHEWIPPGQPAMVTTSRETCARIAKPGPQ